MVVQTRKIIVCGVIAQCFFELATSVTGWYLKDISLFIFGKNTQVFYASHPSQLSDDGKSKWLDAEHRIKLSKFIENHKNKYVKQDLS